MLKQDSHLNNMYHNTLQPQDRHKVVNFNQVNTANTNNNNKIKVYHIDLLAKHNHLVPYAIIHHQLKHLIDKHSTKIKDLIRIDLKTTNRLLMIDIPLAIQHHFTDKEIQEILLITGLHKANQSSKNL